MERVGAVILAAGEAKRFGSNKLMAELDGRPLISWVLDAVSHLDRALIVGKYAREIIEAFPREVSIYNPFYLEGMSTSVKLGVRFFQDKEWILFVPGDMPWLNRRTVDRVLSAASPSCDSVVPIHQGVRGNPVLISNGLFPELLQLKGDVGAREVIVRYRRCEVECGKEVTLDVDYPTDLSSSRRPV